MSPTHLRFFATGALMSVFLCAAGLGLAAAQDSSHLSSSILLETGFLPNSQATVSETAFLDHSLPVSVSGQLERQVADHVDLVLGGSVLSARPEVSALGERPLRLSRWTVPTLVSGVRYTLARSSRVEIGITPALTFAGRTSLDLTSAIPVLPRLTTAGGLGYSIGADVRFPAGRWSGDRALLVSIRYASWVWPATGNVALPMRLLTVGAGVVFRH